MRVLPWRSWSKIREWSKILISLYLPAVPKKCHILRSLEVIASRIRVSFWRRPLIIPCQEVRQLFHCQCMQSKQLCISRNPYDSSSSSRWVISCSVGKPMYSALNNSIIVEQNFLSLFIALDSQIFQYLLQCKQVYEVRFLPSELMTGRVDHDNQDFEQSMNYDFQHHFWCKGIIHDASEIALEEIWWISPIVSKIVIYNCWRLFSRWRWIYLHLHGCSRHDE